MALWCLTEHHLPQESVSKEMAALVDGMVEQLEIEVDHTHKIPGQVHRQVVKLKCKLVDENPTELLGRLDKWLPSLLSATLSENKELANESYSCLSLCIEKLELGALAETSQCILPHLGTLGTKMTLLLSKSREIQATQVWSVIISLLGSKSLKAAVANPLFKVMEKTFVSKQAPSRVASYAAWKVLIDVWKRSTCTYLGAFV